MSQIINIADYRKNTEATTSYNNQITFTGRRPISISNIADIPFKDDTPKKKKNAADPIKNISDINRVIDYFISNNQYRNLLLFTMGISFGFRCGDLLRIKIGHILDQTGNYRSEVVLQEEKTKKIRTCYMNDAVMDAADLYFSSIGKDSKINLNDYLFRSQSNNGSNINRPLETNSVETMLKLTINNKLGVNIHAGTHCMRKTFAYHVIMNAPDRSRAIEFLQKILGHSSPNITLAYAGITNDEIRETCQNLYKGKLNFCYSSGLTVNSKTM